MQLGSNVCFSTLQVMKCCAACGLQLACTSNLCLAGKTTVIGLAFHWVDFWNERKGVKIGFKLDSLVE